MSRETLIAVLVTSVACTLMGIGVALWWMNRVLR